MARVYLPQNLTVLFTGAPREVNLSGPTVLQVIEGLNVRWPGMRSRLLDPGPALREHILIFVDGERAGLDTPVREDSAVRIVPSITGG